MFYKMQEEKLAIFDDSKEQLLTTLEFMPQLVNEYLLETDIVTEEELRQYPNKVMVDDIEIEIEVPDYEITTEEYEEVIYETELVEEEYQEIVYDEEGNPVLDAEGNFTYETKTRMVEKQIMEEVEETILVPVYDEDGLFIEEREKLIIKIVPKTHTETKTRETKTLIGYHKEMITVKGLVLNPNFEQEEKDKERERLNGLKCTKRVFALMLQEVGVDYLTVLKPLIESNPQAQLEWELCVELERGNPLLDIMASQLNVTSEHLDLIFKFANNEITQEEFALAVAKKKKG